MTTVLEIETVIFGLFCQIKLLEVGLTVNCAWDWNRLCISVHDVQDFTY
jgi:hypothetical protein